MNTKLIHKSEGKIALWRCIHRWQANIQIDIKLCTLHLSGLGYIPVAGYYEGSNRPLDSVTGWEWLLAYQNGICSVELVSAFSFHIFSYDNDDRCYCAVLVKHFFDSCSIKTNMCIDLDCRNWMLITVSFTHVTHGSMWQCSWPVTGIDSGTMQFRAKTIKKAGE
jgi:hypothetical protein